MEFEFKPGSVASLEFARLCSIMRRTPVHRRDECMALLKYESELVGKLINVRSELDELAILPVGGRLAGEFSDGMRWPRVHQLRGAGEVGNVQQ